MNARFIIVIVIALVIAGATASLVRGKMNTVKPTDTIKVLAATTDIPVGGFVRADRHLAWVEWPKGTVTQSYITEGKHNIVDFEGAVARRAIMSGEPISSSVLVRSSEGGFLSAVLNPGMRAVSISVTPISGNAGFIFPGDRVDLILTHQVSAVNTSNPNMLASETFIENVRVVAVDQRLDNPTDNKATIAKTVTLEVLPKQAEMINVAGRLGNISLSLRSWTDDLNVAKEGGKPSGNKENTGGPFEPVAGEDAASIYGSRLTRDSDVSKLLSDRSGLALRVDVIRGNERQAVEFNQDLSGKPQNNPDQ